MPPTITEDEIGKDVVTDEGQTVGTVVEIDADMLYVDFTGDDETQREKDIDADEIKEITDDEIVLSEPETT